MFLRFMFKGLYPEFSFDHLHRSTTNLLAKIFSNEAYLYKISPHIYIDQDLANRALPYNISKIFANLKSENNEEVNILAFKTALMYADKEGIKEVPWFLK